MHRDDFSITVQDIVIKGTLLICPVGEAGAKSVVVLCHGIPGGANNPVDRGYAHLAETLESDGHCVAFFNFRGAGDSGGNFDIRGWVEDLRAVVSWLRERFSRPPVLVGFSAGGAVAVCAARSNSGCIGGLILCGSPAEFTRVLGAHGSEQFLEHARAIGIIRHADFPADRDAWARGFREVCAEKNIGGCGLIPKLIIHGDADDTVPVDHAYRLYEAASQPKDLAIIKGGGHRLRLNEEAMNIARQWLKQVGSEV